MYFSSTARSLLFAFVRARATQRLGIRCVTSTSPSDDSNASPPLSQAALARRILSSHSPSKPRLQFKAPPSIQEDSTVQSATTATLDAPARNVEAVDRITQARRAGSILKRFENRKPFTLYKQRPASLPSTKAKPPPAAPAPATTTATATSTAAPTTTTETTTLPVPAVARTYVPGSLATRRRWKAPWRVALDEAQRLIDDEQTRAAELSLRRALAPGPEPHSSLGAMLRAADSGGNPDGIASGVQVEETREMRVELLRVLESLVRGYARAHDSRGMVRMHTWLWAMSWSSALMGTAAAAAATAATTVAASSTGYEDTDVDLTPLETMKDVSSIPGVLSPSLMRIMVEFHAQHAEFEVAMRVLRQLRATVVSRSALSATGEMGEFMTAIEVLAMAHGKLGHVDKVRSLMNMVRSTTLRSRHNDKEGPRSPSSTVPSLGMYHAAMVAHREAGDGAAAVALLRRIVRLRSVPLTSESFNIVLQYYVEQQRLEAPRRSGIGAVFGLLNGMSNVGVSPDATTFELLLQLHGQRGDARSIARTLHEMQACHVSATRAGLRAVLALHADQSDLDAVLEVANEMHRSYGLARTDDVLLYALRAACHTEAMPELRAAIDDMHSCKVVAGTQVFDELLAQALHSNDSRWIDELHAVYSQLRSRAPPSRNSHNAAVALASRKSAERAEAAINDMAADGFPADERTYTRLLEAYLRQNNLKAARLVLRRAELAGFALTATMLEPLMQYHSSRGESQGVAQLAHLLAFVGSPPSPTTITQPNN